ncbi:beta-ketoacyl-[acyl-carrier-protein] synthase family protein [Nocardia aurantiaca]|uniref:3-ketoacyl-ACP synthase n=1 Tax=Nocardia aurantiaca TaxID=2675850 RepID=A0A6I3KPK0_9NOCA|nr:beta-ketoacyl-[acyl-carrier-protein] synthase family protein [Nocardia aurantiaca]MTE12543.1 3-ketoacyl-ACP synthase [Nocardia aurantiaca]
MHETPHPAPHRRIVITSLGAITAHGVGAEELWQRVRGGEVAIRPLRELAVPGLAAAIGGEILDPPRPKYDYLAPLGLTDPEPAVDYALIAAEEAMAGAGLGVLEEGAPPRSDALSAHRWGVAFGSCNSGIRSAEKAVRRAVEAGRTVDARELGLGDDRHLLLVPPQFCAEALSAAFGLKGPVLSVNTACASSAHALAHAVEQIRAGRADAMLVGGSDALTEMAYYGFTSVESLSARPARPYSRDRDGLSLGAGAGMMVLAAAEVALAAGAPIIAEVLGYGMSADGYHATAPHPQGAGAARAIRAAIETAGLTPADVPYINGHGTGTPKNDAAESNAVRAALGEAASEVVLSSTKSMIGHLLGAAGAVEAIVTILGLRDEMAPPTAGFAETDPACGLDPAPNAARELPLRVAASNNFAFAGANACVVYGRPGGVRAEPVAHEADEVVVTGIGVLMGDAADTDQLWDAWCANAAETERHNGLRLARVGIDPGAEIPAKARRRMDRLGQMAVATSNQALAAAGLRAHEGVGVVVGTGIGPMSSISRFFEPTVAGGPAQGNPAIFPNTVFNAAAGQVAMVLGAKGPTSTLTAGHAAGAAALGTAFDLLRAGRADAVLCTGVDELSPYALDAYRGAGLFTGRHGRDYLLAEGSVTLLLERAAAARQRGVTPIAVLAGYATTSDALGIARWDPRGHGIERAMRDALAEAASSPADLTAVWTAAAGLPTVDGPERRAIDRLGLSANCARHAPKRVLGDPIGAGAHLAAALAVTAWRHGGERGPVLVNGSSLGGTHTSLVLRHPAAVPIRS